MISVGLLLIISDWKQFHKHPAGMFTKYYTKEQLAELREVRRLSSTLPTPSKEMLDEQRSAFEAYSHHPVEHVQTVAEPTEKAVETHGVDTAQTNPQAQWQHVSKPSACLAARIAEFEASADHPDPDRRGF